MISVTRIAAAVYVLVVFTGGYLAVSTIKGLWSEAGRFQHLADAADQGAGQAANRVLVFGSISPAAGDE